MNLSLEWQGVQVLVAAKYQSREASACLGATLFVRGTITLVLSIKSVTCEGVVFDIGWRVACESLRDKALWVSG